MLGASPVSWSWMTNCDPTATPPETCESCTFEKRVLSRRQVLLVRLKQCENDLFLVSSFPSQKHSPYCRNEVEFCNSIRMKSEMSLHKEERRAWSVYLDGLVQVSKSRQSYSIGDRHKQAFKKTEIYHNLVIVRNWFSDVCIRI